MTYRSLVSDELIDLGERKATNHEDIEKHVDIAEDEEAIWLRVQQ